MLRHGSTILNESQLYRGWSNGPDAQLDEMGQQQAREGAAFLSKLAIPIEHVICSDMERAQETATIVCSILGIEEYKIDPRLRPLNVGNFAGKPKNENP